MLNAKHRPHWLIALWCVALIPVFPEYIAPILAAVSFVETILDARSRGTSLGIGKTGKWLFFYVVYMLFGIVYATSRLSTLATTGMWIVMGAIYLTLLNVLSDRDRLRTFLWLVTLVAGSLGLLAIVQYIISVTVSPGLISQLWNFLDEWLYQWFPMPLILNQSSFRSAATFNNPNVFAEYLVMMLPFVIGYAFSERDARRRCISRLCVLSACVGLLFTFSRGSYFALIALVFVFCLFNLRHFSVIGLNLAAVGILLPNKVLARLSYFSMQDIAISERLKIWEICLDRISDRPVFGIGAGIQGSWDTLLAAGVDAPHAHNVFLQLLLEGGAIGFLLMLMLLASVVYTAVVALRRRGDLRLMKIALIAFAVGFVVYGLVEFPLMCPKLVGIFVTAVALADVVGCLDGGCQPLNPSNRHRCFYEKKR